MPGECLIFQSLNSNRKEKRSPFHYKNQECQILRRFQLVLIGKKTVLKMKKLLQNIFRYVGQPKTERERGKTRQFEWSWSFQTKRSSYVSFLFNLQELAVYWPHLAIFFSSLQNICISMHKRFFEANTILTFVMQIGMDKYIYLPHSLHRYTYMKCVKFFQVFPTCFFFSFLQKKRRILSLKCNSHSNSMNRFCARFAIFCFAFIFLIRL